MIKERNIAVCIILSLITCGIYAVYWMICLNNDTNNVAGVEAPSGLTVVLLTLVTCGIYGLYWMYKMGERIDTAKVNRGETSNNNAIIYLILTIFGFSIVAYALLQSELNKFA